MDFMADLTRERFLLKTFQHSCLCSGTERIIFGALSAFRAGAFP